MVTIHLAQTIYQALLERNELYDIICAISARQISATADTTVAGLADNYLRKSVHPCMCLGSV